mmetsp:Transcript_11750/g.20067  ORF Transcript_11750/g.20067 Transcript_11750/m.20067 type:complete len:116 (-) Transcript_11750:97-444(-)
MTGTGGQQWHFTEYVSDDKREKPKYKWVEFNPVNYYVPKDHTNTNTYSNTPMYSTQPNHIPQPSMKPTKQLELKEKEEYKAAMFSSFRIGVTKNDSSLISTTVGALSSDRITKQK